MEDEVLLGLLSQNPALRQRIEGILRVAGNLQESIELADTAEEQLIEEGRHLNREALQAWASSKASQSATQFEKRHKSTRKDIKKNSIGTAHLEKSK